MNTNDPFAPFEVFEGTAWQARLLMSILADNEIECLINDPVRLTWNMAGAVVETAKVFVAGKDLERAMEIVEGFKLNLGMDNVNEGNIEA